MNRRRWVSIAAAAGMLASLALAAPANAGMDNLCGWNGNVVPLMAKADKQVKKVDVTSALEPYFGPIAMVTDYDRMEVDLTTKNPESTNPKRAKTLTRNLVTYNVTVVLASGKTQAASIQLRYAGLCWRGEQVVPEPWVGSIGTSKPLKVSANKALKLAQAYRVKHQDEFPLDQPLVMMNLMQSTTAPPDFGKLRWYVNYEVGGGVNILAVYMNGKVVPIGYVA